MINCCGIQLFCPLACIKPALIIAPVGKLHMARNSNSNPRQASLDQRTPCVIIRACLPLPGFHFPQISWLRGVLCLTNAARLHGVSCRSTEEQSLLKVAASGGSNAAAAVTMYRQLHAVAVHQLPASRRAAPGFLRLTTPLGPKPLMMELLLRMILGFVGALGLAATAANAGGLSL